VYAVNAEYGEIRRSAVLHKNGEERLGWMNKFIKGLI
jgi:hypothetical protein